jgi:lipopolysaccharide transport system ATP-binding protein
LLKPFGEKEDNPAIEEFWALKDVSFEVKQGEVIGIIGRNGAGKSTLLKILSRITEPTTGRVAIKGRVASLLEVGTGFHPELTGRENIYLNGAILGMSKVEIKRKFDEIVAFAEVEKFLDTPVKRYSSGMYVRLAFAVAAHLEPEILVVDEVLAVGDAQFQKKCLGKMGNVATKEGRTVFFVSHNMTAVQRLCSNCIWLDRGCVVEIGETNQVTTHYLQKGAANRLEQIWNEPNTAPGNEQVRLHRASIISNNDSELDVITTNTNFQLEFVFWNYLDNTNVNFSLNLFTIEGLLILNSVSKPIPVSKGLLKGICYIPKKFLNDLTYTVEIMIVENSAHLIYYHPDVLTFDIHDDGKRLGDWHGKWAGLIRPEFKWEVIS